MGVGRAIAPGLRLIQNCHNWRSKSRLLHRTSLPPKIVPERSNSCRALGGMGLRNFATPILASTHGLRIDGLRIASHSANIAMVKMRESSACYFARLRQIPSLRVGQVREPDRRCAVTIHILHQI